MAAEKSYHMPEVRGGGQDSEEAVPGPSVFPSGEPGVSGDFWAHPWPITPLPLPNTLISPCITRPEPRGQALPWSPLDLQHRAGCPLLRRYSTPSP